MAFGLGKVEILEVDFKSVACGVLCAAGELGDLLGFHTPVLGQPEGADEPGKEQTGGDEGDEEHECRHNDDQSPVFGHVTLAPRRQGQGEGECRQTSHAAPGDDQAVPPRSRHGPAVPPDLYEAQEKCGGEADENAHRDDGGRHA